MLAKYKRYINNEKLTKEQKIELLSLYITFYKNLIRKKDINELNKKMPRDYAEGILDEIGALLVRKANELSKEEGPIKQFLKDNPLPTVIKDKLPDNFRVFSLILNALKQWVSAESNYTDRFLLGGTAREICKLSAKKCLVTGKNLGQDRQLHHPLRDGRPPIVLSKCGHAMIEHQLPAKSATSRFRMTDNTLKIKKLKADRHGSRVLLKEGLLFLLGKTEKARPLGISFARKVIKETGLNPEEILKLLKDESLI